MNRNIAKTLLTIIPQNEEKSKSNSYNIVKIFQIIPDNTAIQYLELSIITNSCHEMIADSSFYIRYHLYFSLITPVSKLFPLRVNRRFHQLQYMPSEPHGEGDIAVELWKKLEPGEK